MLRRAQVPVGCAPVRHVPVRRAGFSLVETAIYLAVLGVVGGPIILMMLNSTRSTSEATIQARVLERNRAAMQRIAADFRFALDGSVAVSNSGTVLTFTLPGGFDGTGPTAGNVVSYAILDASDDADNGSDDNGNGVVDEKQLVRINQTTVEQVSIASMLDEDSSGFEANGGGVTVALTTVGLAPGSTIETKIQQTVTLYPRN